MIFNSTKIRLFFQVLALFLALEAVPAAAQQSRPDPEISTGIQEKTALRGKKFMIVTADAQASKAGYDILAKGGSAIDAAIAAQLVLGLVEPQSSGLGGGAFVLYYDAQEKRLSSFDARETAPMMAGPFHFYEEGQAMPFMEAVVGGRAVGVPGVPMLLEDLHQLYGRLTWMELFDEAIRLAKEGFTVSPRLSRQIEASRPYLLRDAVAARYLFDQSGQPRAAGFKLSNPAYENTLRDFAFYGASRFYSGQFANDIVYKVQNVAHNPGLLVAQDFEQYAVKRRDPVCGPYRAYIVCSMGEPSSGGLTLLQTLGMLERFDLRSWGAQDARSWNVIAQASRLAFADRNLYMADPDFVDTPGVALLDPVYVAQRASLIEPEIALEGVQAGKPPLWNGPEYRQGIDKARPGTSHISVIDALGNIVSMTTTIEGAFGAHIMSNGYFLNNELTDFSFAPFQKNEEREGQRHGHGAPIANAIEGGKRPRSSMTPVVMFDSSGAPILVIGSAGGGNIIGYLAQRIVSLVDWDIELQEALDMPNILARGETVEMESDKGGLKAALEGFGNKVDIGDKNSGLTAIRITPDGLYGAADSRREGQPAGQ